MNLGTDYRGFRIYYQHGSWWAAFGPSIRLGPFQSERDAERAVDKELRGSYE